jgi:fibronectin type 3 domain-containing protein
MTKWTGRIYRTDDNRELIELQRGDAISLNIALMQGRVSYEEIAAIRQAQKETSDADDM